MGWANFRFINLFFNKQIILKVTLIKTNAIVKKKIQNLSLNLGVKGIHVHAHIAHVVSQK